MWIKDLDPGDPKRPDPDPQHWLKQIKRPLLSDITLAEQILGSDNVWLLH